MNNQAKDKNPNKQEATSSIVITYKNDQGFGLKINNKKKSSWWTGTQACQRLRVCRTDHSDRVPSESAQFFSRNKINFYNSYELTSQG